MCINSPFSVSNSSSTVGTLESWLATAFSTINKWGAENAPAKTKTQCRRMENYVQISFYYLPYKAKENKPKMCCIS